MADAIKSGIYEIVNLVNGKRYVGSAVNLDKRWKMHRWLLGNDRHVNRHLQRSWRRHGDVTFHFRIIERCDKTILIEREQFYLDVLRPEFNICPTAGSRLGALYKPHSVETRAKIGKASRKAWAHQDSRKRMSNAQRGKKHSAETRLKMSVAKLGKKKSAETIARIRAAAIADGRRPPGCDRSGSQHSEETRAKMSAAALGRKKSEETRANMRAAWKLRKAQRETEMQP